MSASLTVYSRSGDKQTVALEPEGVLIGRGPDCAVHLKASEVSRRHARIFQDPFGRWVLEDLGSSNGTWVDKERIQACALLPGKRIRVGNFALVFSDESRRQIAPDSRLGGKTTVSESDTGDVMLAEADNNPVLGHSRMQLLDELAERVAELSGPDELYPEVCRCVAEVPGQMAAVLRLCGGPDSVDSDLLALHFGGTDTDGEGDLSDLMAADVHLSRRVLAAVVRSGRAALAGNIQFTSEQMRLTVDDARHPRTVCCAPIAALNGELDVLYLDLPFDESNTDVLDFVRAAARHVGLARKSLLLAVERLESSQLDEQLAWAREIQRRLMPKSIRPMSGVDIAAYCMPALWVGGDYCDMWQVPDGRLALCMADVAGKGLPAAMVMSNLQAGLRSTMTFCLDPPQVIEHINAHLNATMPDDTMITMFLGLYSPADGTLDYVNAGHIPPMKVSGSQSVSRFGDPTSPPLGIPDTTFEAATGHLESGAGLVWVTDGVTEAGSPDGKMLGLDGLQDLLADAPADSAQKLVEQVVRRVEEFRQGLPNHDDMTVLALLAGGG